MTTTKLQPTFAIGLACCSLLCCDVVGFAADPVGAKAAQPKPATSSLDDELFKDLGGDTPTPKAAPPKSEAPKKETPKSDERPAAKDRNTEPKAEPKPASQPSRSTPAPKLTDPLDRELLKDLGGDADTKPEQKPGSGHGASGDKPAGGDESGGAESGGESDDPLVRLTRRVRDAEQRLRRTDSGDKTQELQRGIVEDLEKLIAQIEQQKAKQSSSKSKGPPSGSKPGQKKPGQKKPGNEPGSEPNPNPTDSSEQLTAKKAEKPQAGKLKEMLEKVWGQLPERERQDVMQSSFEDFPAKYQFGIEQYFKALLQRKD